MLLKKLLNNFELRKYIFIILIIFIIFIINYIYKCNNKIDKMTNVSNTDIKNAIIKYYSSDEFIENLSLFTIQNNNNNNKDLVIDGNLNVVGKLNSYGEISNKLHSLTKLNNSFKSISSTQKFSLINVANDIRNGKYIKIQNSTFGLKNNFDFWKLRIDFVFKQGGWMWQSILGNMYNREVDRGWGLWVNPYNFLHWSESANTYNLENIGKLKNNDEYRLDIIFLKNRYSFFLSHKTSTKSDYINKISPLITNKGFVTFGGHWERISGELFQGSINNIIFSNDFFE